MPATKVEEELLYYVEEELLYYKGKRATSYASWVSPPPPCGSFTALTAPPRLCRQASSAP